mmetsp:Transcript_25809/g.29738  ORF Transcript_25809/g.29738 Transcript_25809/m.29738 type:complete len:170 (-) Transcript_25809:259-768(-)
MRCERVSSTTKTMKMDINDSRTEINEDSTFQGLSFFDPEHDDAFGNAIQWLFRCSSRTDIEEDEPDEKTNRVKSELGVGDEIQFLNLQPNLSNISCDHFEIDESPSFASSILNKYCKRTGKVPLLETNTQSLNTRNAADIIHFTGDKISRAVTSAMRLSKKRRTRQDLK